MDPDIRRSRRRSRTRRGNLVTNLPSIHPYSKDDEDEKRFIWWNAYSANGTAFAPVVYVNYANEQDFDDAKRVSELVLSRFYVDVLTDQDS